MRRGMDVYNERLLAVTAELGVECVDLSGMHGNPEYFYDDCHFNPAGAREVARLLLRHLARDKSVGTLAASFRDGDL